VLARSLRQRAISLREQGYQLFIVRVAEVGAGV